MSAVSEGIQARRWRRKVRKAQMWLEIVKLLGAPLLAGVVAAVLSNYFAAEFSLRRFRREQWWQEKRDAYEAIIRRVALIGWNASRQLNRIDTGGEQVPPQAPASDETFAWSLQEIASAGEYIVSAKTVKAVQKVLNTLCYNEKEGDDPYDSSMWTTISVASSEALAVIRSEAHRELGMKR